MDCTYKNDKDKWISCDIALMSFLSINVATSPVGKLLLKDSNKHKRVTSMKIILEFLLLSLNRYLLNWKVTLKMKKGNRIFTYGFLMI